MSRFQVFLRVLFCHVLVLGMIIMIPLMKGCDFFPEKEQIITVDLASLPLPPPPEEDPPDEPEAEEPDENRIPEATPKPAPSPTPPPQPTATPAPEAIAIPTSTPAPTATPKPQPTPTPTSALLTPEQIRARIADQQTPPPPPAAPTLTPQQIRELISQGLPPAGGTGTAVGPIPPGAGVNFGGVSGELQRRLYSAWDQPMHLSATSGIHAIASVVVLKNGTIRSGRILRSSGNAEFDASVQRALSSVKFAKELPESYRGSDYTFEIEFNLAQ